MAPATQLYHFKFEGEDGAILEMVIWLLPAPVPGSSHRYKYRLFYGRDGKRLVGYDNERGKGDHRHIRGRESTYHFVSVEQLIEDFKADVRRIGGVA